jgi:hypothetical protein
MRVIFRSLMATILAVLGAIVLAVAWTATTAVQLAATALIMGGTDHPLSTPEDDPVTYINPYMDNAVEGFINPASGVPTGTGLDPIFDVGETDNRYAVITPEQFFPVSGSMTFGDSVEAGLENVNGCVRGDGCVYNEDGALVPDAPEDPPVPGEEMVVFGYSQSAVIASLLKRDLIENPDDTPADLSMFLLANAMRPNGGILAMGPTGLTIPILGVTFYGATPTNSCESEAGCIETVDLAAQYDIFGGDSPASYTNVVAIVNAALGYYYLHGDLQNGNFDNALYQGSYGDTDYYIVATERLPLLLPFEPIVPSPILTMLDAPIRAMVEGAYARDVNPGVATKASLLPFRNPIATIVNIIKAIPVGIDDGLAEFTGNPDFRPLGTEPVTSPFGVGGPELPDPPSEMNLSALSASAQTGDGAPAARLDDEPEDTAVEEEEAVDEEAVDEEADDEDAVDDEEVVDEDAVDEESAEEVDETETPEVTEPETPSATDPDDNETATGEPDSGGDEDGQEAA